MRPLRRLAIVLVLLGAGIGVPSTAAQAGVSTFTGTCQVNLRASRVGTSVSITTPIPGWCFTGNGPGTLTITGQVGAGSVFPGFTCAGGAGIGAGSIVVTAPLGGMTANNMFVTVVNAAGAIQLAMTLDYAGQQVYATGTFAQTPTAVGACQGLDPVDWRGSFTFSSPSVTGGVSTISGTCQVNLVASRVGTSVSVTTPIPGWCFTGNGAGTITITGQVGAGSVFPGFTCAGGAGIGAGNLFVDAPLGSLTANNMFMTVANGAGVVQLTMTLDYAGQQVYATGTFAQTPTAVGACQGLDPVMWRGAFSFSSPSIS